MDPLLIFLLVTAGLAAGLAIIAGVREWGAPGHKTFVAGLLLLAAETVLAVFITSSETAAEAASWRGWCFLVQALIPSTWLCFSIVYSRGNYPHFVQRWLLVLLAALGVPLVSAFFFQDGLITETSRSLTSWEFRLGLAGFLIQLSMLAGSALVLVNLERTFRASVGISRWRIKFIVLGVGLIFTTRLYTSSQSVLFGQADTSSDIIRAVGLLISCGFLARALLRPNAFGVEVYPAERSSEYSIVGFCVGAYLIVVGATSKQLGSLDRTEAFAVKAFLLLLALAALAVLLLSERARDRLRRYLSRQFHRSMYNYRTTWLSFTEKTSTVVDAPSLCRISVNWISETLRVLSVSVWLCEEEQAQLALAASTGLTDKAGETNPLSRDEVLAVAAALRNEPNPFFIDSRTEEWAVCLAKCYPSHFQDVAGSRVCVPLASGGRLLGFLTLNHRVDSVPFGLEEFDLLKCVGDQIASGLLNLHLSRRLLQAREMEAFQTIAAFFVHDLKNTASSLNLTLQNLPKYWDNPEFRKDALKAIGKSVQHIHELISRLSLFRQNLQIQPRETDVNALVTSTAACLGSGVSLVTRLGDLPKVKLDPSQIEKVLTNLFLNARDALRENGLIQVETSLQGNWIAISVTDNGCGMSPEFLSRSLFRPFQTTKKGGIGIGMFQSKTIVEAHGGRIEVESQPGQGTTFRVLLPANPPAPTFSPVSAD